MRFSENLKVHGMEGPLCLQEKHVETAKQLLGDGRALNRFVARILDDIANLKAMLQAISIGALRGFFDPFLDTPRACAWHC